MRRFCVFMVLVALAVSSVHAIDKEKNLIFLCIGQSNMEGNATPESQDKTGVSNHFKKMYVANSDGDNIYHWATAVPPLARKNTGLTPVDYFGRYLVDSLAKDYYVRVIVVAIAGCSIKIFLPDKCEDYIKGEADWMQNIAAEYDNNPYERLIAAAKEAQKYGNIRGVLLHQGETDAYSDEWLNNVKKVYVNIIRDLELNVNDVPLLAGEVVNADQNGQCAGANTTINKLPNVLKTAYVISSKGCPAGADNLHFSAEGYRMLGKRYGAKMFQILKEKGVATRSSVESVEASHSDIIYDLSGRKLDAPTIGLQIIGGKKVYYAE